MDRFVIRKKQSDNLERNNSAKTNPSPFDKHVTDKNVSFSVAPSTSCDEISTTGSDSEKSKPSAAPEKSNCNKNKNNSASTTSDKQDIAAIISDELAHKNEPIKQIKLSIYPKNNQGRMFRSEWYSTFPWLEYSPTLDSAFCYVCRLYAVYTKELAFVKTGYNNWKHACDKTKSGFHKHESSSTHIEAVAFMNEQKTRRELNVSVETLVNDSVLEKRRYYVKSIIEVVQFLVVNELALRGNYNLDEHVEQGLFENLFEFTIRKYEKLAEICNSSVIPKNATYKSPEIQNEIIQIMTEAIQEDVANEVNTSDVPLFTLLEDGTKDKNRRENVATALRYVKDKHVYESILSIESTEKLDAETFTNVTLETLERKNVKPENMLSQCYDGASVMSGSDGGVQALIQKKLKKIIPYVHCFNHKLHLVVVKTAETW
ncbi:unnamed protein product [Bemisia tabaci]|uniref:TTF-type domain-containing protein n=1 Tax=Bemisia tabaci TaxID=7038 RepID=A0A9P0F1U1_BEMTA|nr:unnamed protein product [Bemisia tabaci]